MQKFKGYLLIIWIFIVLGCASQAKQVRCTELRYSLENLRLNREQEYFLQKELAECALQADSLQLEDAKKRGSIYEQFRLQNPDKAQDTVLQEEL